MALTLFTLLAKLGIDTSDYTKGLDDAVKHAEKSSKGIIHGLSVAGAGVVAGLGVAAVATGAYLNSTIAPASDLAETVSKVGVVFGDQGDAMLAWAQNAATAMGMTQNQALAAAGTYGNLFRSMNIAEDASAGMSMGLVDLAADLASFNNIDPAVALEKLRAGLTGEAEPLKSLGVNINQALLEQKALEMGLWNGEGALDAAAKAQASYALILEQTTLAQGDFARASDGLANQQRITAATMGDVKATIGTALLPAVTALQAAINGVAQNPAFQEFLAKAVEALGGFAAKVVEAIPKVIETFQTVSDWLSEHEGVIVGVLVALGAAVAAFVYTTVIPAAAAAVAALAPIALPIIAIAAIVALLYEAWTKDWGGIRTTLTAVWEGTLKPIFETIKAWLEVNIPKAIDGLTRAFNWVKEHVLQPVAGAFDAISTAIQKVIGWVGDVGDKLAGIKDKLPDWLVPGSPTPFELGLLGILDAMKKISATPLDIQAQVSGLDDASRGAIGGTQSAVDLTPDWTPPPDLFGLVVNAVVEAQRRRRVEDGGERERAEAPVRDISLTIQVYGQASVDDIEIGVVRGLGSLGISRVMA